MSPVTNKIIQFIYAINGQPKAKEKKSIQDKVSKVVLRFRRNKIDAATEEARRIASNCNAQFSFNENAQPMDDDDVMDLKRIVESYSLEICEIIARSQDLGAAVEISVRTTTFFREWNGQVKKLDQKFLEGYGDIYPRDIIMSKNVLQETLATLKRCKKVPPALKLLVKDNVADSIDRCLDMTTAFATIGRNTRR